MREGGEAALEDAELVALLLGRATVDQARALLADRGGLRGIARAGLAQLERYDGAGPVGAARLRAAFELGRRARVEAAPDLGSVFHPRDVYAFYRERLGHLEHERLCVLLLDARNRVFRHEEIARGGLTSVSVYPREILAPAIREMAASIMLVHNHPSGEPDPSPHDKHLTRRVREAGRMVGIPLLDHVIIGAERAVSLRTLQETAGIPWG